MGRARHRQHRRQQRKELARAERQLRQRQWLKLASSGDFAEVNVAAFKGHVLAHFDTAFGITVGEDGTLRIRDETRERERQREEERQAHRRRTAARRDMQRQPRRTEPAAAPVDREQDPALQMVSYYSLVGEQIRRRAGPGVEPRLWEFYSPPARSPISVALSIVDANINPPA